MKYCITAILLLIFHQANALDAINWSEMRGFNVDASTVQETDIIALQGFGANIIRLQFANLPLFVASPASLNGRAVSKLDQIISWCDGHGIKIIIDPHTFSGFKNRFTTVPEDEFWHDKELQNSLAENWQIFSIRYSKSETIVAFDLLNEPSIPSKNFSKKAYNWGEIAESIVKLIRSVDTDHYIFVGSPIGMADTGRWLNRIEGTSTLPSFHDRRIVYNVHVYVPSEFTTQQIYGSSTAVKYPGLIGKVYWDDEQLRRAIQPALALRDRTKSQIFVGEFSAPCWTASDGDNYLKDLLELFHVSKIGWTYHAFRESPIWNAELDSNQCVQLTKKRLTSSNSSISRINLLTSFMLQ